MHRLKEIGKLIPTTPLSRWLGGLLAVSILLALGGIPPSRRGSLGYVVEAMALVSMMTLLLHQNRDLLRTLGKRGLILLTLLVALTAAQLIKAKALFPFVSWSMYSARISDPVVREYTFQAWHKSGRSSSFVPATHMASLAYSRAPNGVRNSLQHCFGPRPDSSCTAERERTLGMLRALVRYANETKELADPITRLTVVKNELAPPYAPAAIQRTEVLSMSVESEAP